MNEPTLPNHEAIIDMMCRCSIDAKTALASLDAALEVEKAKSERIQQNYNDLLERTKRFIDFAVDFPSAPAYRCVEEFIK